MDKPTGPEAIAKAKLAEMKAKKEADASAKATSEAKKPDVKAPAEGDKTPEEKKPSESQTEKSVLEKAEEQAAADKVILETAEDQLNDDQKARKAEIQKIAEKKPSAGKVIDDLKKELKDLKAEVGKSTEDKNRIAAMEAELKELREKVSQPGEIKKADDELSKREKERVSKYLAEDKAKPREERREMPKDELEAWFIEDPIEAQAWITKRVMRQDRERREDAASLANQNKATDIKKGWLASEKKVFVKHPDLEKVNERVTELKAEGKTNAEMKAIIQKEDPKGFEKSNLCAEIMNEEGATFHLKPNGPELLMEEMERRLAKKKPVKKETDEEHDARVAEEAAEAERQRQEAIDEGLNTNTGKTPEGKETPEYKAGFKEYQKAFPKKTKADYDKVMERRRGIGANA